MLVSTNTYQRERFQWNHTLFTTNINTTPRTLFRAIRPISTQILAKIVQLRYLYKTILQESAADTHRHTNKKSEKALYHLSHTLSHTVSYHRVLRMIFSQQPHISHLKQPFFFVFLSSLTSFLATSSTPPPLPKWHFVLIISVPSFLGRLIVVQP